MKSENQDGPLPTVRYEPGSRSEPTKADMLQYLTCWLCKGVYRDAHTINECMCTCKYLLYFSYQKIYRLQRMCLQILFGKSHKK